jgi:type IV secretion system protein VirD4
MKAMKNYAGHRLSPWLGHLMVSRSETARPLLTPGEVMQLPPADEIVMIAGVPPIRAKKARYFEDKRLTERILPPPSMIAKQAASRPDNWTSITPLKPSADLLGQIENAEQDAANGGLRREPELPDHVAIVKETTTPNPHQEFDLIDEEPEDAVRQARAFRQQARGVARQVSMDPGDGIEM